MTTAPKLLLIRSSAKIADTHPPLRLAAARERAAAVRLSVCDQASGSSLDVVLISGKAPELTIAMSRRSPFFCHWPATTGVVHTFFTGWPVHLTGPTMV